MTGYNEQPYARDPDQPADRFEAVKAEPRGFAFEGAARSATLTGRVSGGMRRCPGGAGPFHDRAFEPWRLAIRSPFPPVHRTPNKEAVER